MISFKRLNIIFFSLFLLLNIISCSHKPTKKSDFKRRELSEYYVPAGTVGYFLPVAPDWINFSQSATCFRKSPIKHLDFSKVRGSFSLSYEQAIQFQYMINQRFQEVLTRLNIDYILLRDEEKIFHDVSDKIQANLKAFRSPKYKKVYLVWIDQAVNSPTELKKLKKLMQEKKMEQGHPVFVSLCLTHKELQGFMEKHSFSDSNIRIIPFEMFAIFDKASKRMPGFKLYFSELFRADQELTFFVLGEDRLPPEFVGKFNIQNYK